MYTMIRITITPESAPANEGVASEMGSVNIGDVGVYVRCLQEVVIFTLHLTFYNVKIHSPRVF